MKIPPQLRDRLQYRDRIATNDWKGFGYTSSARNNMAMKSARLLTHDNVSTEHPVCFCARKKTDNSHLNFESSQ